ncbi:MAG: YdbL family protein [Gallionella sp.]|nr:YdbL family protein [Gallionella sp.]
MKHLTKFWLVLLAMCVSAVALAEVDIKVTSPGIVALKQSMRARHVQLYPYLDSGAVGLTADGLFALRDAAAVPLAQRQEVNALVAAENNDRNALYAEIANANGHPEWQAEIRSTFAQRWIRRAHAGWWVQSGGGWEQK